MNATTATHRISWWVYMGRERIRHTASMRGHWPGWDATCTCGWDSRTGGAVRSYVQHEVRMHKWETTNGYVIRPQLTTRSELDALPDGSKLLGPDGTVWCHSHSQWWRNDVDHFYHESRRVAARGPLVLIWSPDA